MLIYGPFSIFFKFKQCLSLRLNPFYVNSVPIHRKSEMDWQINEIHENQGENFTLEGVGKGRKIIKNQQAVY